MIDTASSRPMMMETRNEEAMMFTRQRTPEESLLPVRRAPAPRPDSPRAAQLEVDCPLLGARVRVQRCAFCEHGKGMVADGLSHRLLLRCAFTPSNRPSTDRDVQVPEKAKSAR